MEPFVYRADILIHFQPSLQMLLTLNLPRHQLLMHNKFQKVYAVTRCLC